MALDPEERKIAALFAAFEEINARVEAAVGRLERGVGGLDPTVRQTVRDVTAKELQELQHQVRQTTTALQSMRRAADWRQIVMGGALALLAAAITMGGFWLLTPSREELSRLREERDQLQGTIDLLASRGGRAQISKCGNSSEHLCVRVATEFGKYGEGKDYLVIRGY